MEKWEGINSSDIWGSKHLNLLHKAHFDWWMFPIDDGSKEEFNLGSEAHVAQLKGNAVWLEGYRRGIRLAAKAWGWNIDAAARIRGTELYEGMGWTDGKDVRLAKLLRSLWLFEEDVLLVSMLGFARTLHAVEKEGRDFMHHDGKTNLQELLNFTLPRR